MADDADWGNTLDDESIKTLRRMRSKVFGLRGNVAGGTGGKQPDSSVAFSDPGLQFYNDSSEEAPAGACMRVTGFTDSDGETGGTAGKGSPIIKIGKPDATFGLYVCNGGIAVPSKEYGTCYDVGDVEFLYNSGTPARSEGFGPTPSQWYWSKGFPTGIFCYGNLDTSLKIAYGTLSPITTLLGKASGSITARSSTTPGSGSMEIWYNNSGTLTDAGFSDITVKNLSASAVTSGGYIQAKFIAGEWWVDFEDCPA